MRHNGEESKLRIANLKEMRGHSFYASFIVREPKTKPDYAGFSQQDSGYFNHGTRFSPFNTSLYTSLLGSVSNRPVLPTHSNMVRPGAMGLPQGWEMYIYQFRARTNEVLSQPVLDFASTVSARFTYNMRPYLDTNLMDLLTMPTYSHDELKARDNNIPIVIREMTEFEFSVTAEQPLEKFWEYLHGREATFWLYLEGFLRRDVL